VGLSFTNFRTFPNVAPVWVGHRGGELAALGRGFVDDGGRLSHGRLARRFKDATEHESDVRDGAHG